MIQAILVLASLLAAETPSTCSVQLQVESKIKSAQLGNPFELYSEQFTIRIINTGSTTITLVEPGDGSDLGWRTPIITWQVQVVGSVYRSPGVGVCGNINALRPGEVFDVNGTPIFTPSWTLIFTPLPASGFRFCS